MSQPKVYGTFEKRGEHTFRTSTYLQFGDSDKSIGCCLLLNPGSATLEKDVAMLLEATKSVTGPIKTDPTMEQLILFVEGIHDRDNPISGRFHIYNLFNLQNPKSVHAIDHFESLVQSGEYDVLESLTSIEELHRHPFILMGWGVEKNLRWKSLERVKKEWLHLIIESEIPTLGKKHPRHDDYYHPRPHLKVEQVKILGELISQYMQKFSKQRFPVHATEPNLIVDRERIEIMEEDEFSHGWFRSSSNPEKIVKGFSHLRIKDGYKLRGFQFNEGAGGNGIVWAIPAESELPDPNDCKSIDHYFSAPKPAQALDDFMQAIDGDKTPLSYLQASVVFHELNEFGAMWHGVSWGRDVILPISTEDVSENNYEWEMIEDEPEVIDPHFYYNSDGNPVIIFYTINDIGQLTMNRYVHTFSKSDYTLEVERTVIATADGGIIF